MHPVPPFGIEDPVIQHLLMNWTSDPQKLRYVSLWLTVLAGTKEITETFPAGLQLVSLRPEIKDGFLTLIVPILRKSRGSRVSVKVRPEGEKWGLKIKVSSVDDVTAESSQPTSRRLSGGQRVEKSNAEPAPSQDGTRKAVSLSSRIQMHLANPEDI